MDDGCASSLQSLPARDKGRYVAVIEATQGTRQKMKYEPRWNAFVLSGILPLGLSFPYDFGFVPSTLGEDGDPLDVLVLADEAIPVGTVVPCRLVGLIEAEQRDEGEKAKRNDRLIAVAAESHRYAQCKSIGDVASSALAEVESFFESQNAQRDGRFKVLARRDRHAAEHVVEAGERAFAQKYRRDRARR